MYMQTGEHFWKKKKWRTVGSNQQPLDSKPNVLPTELRREICGAGLQLLLYSAEV